MEIPIGSVVKPWHIPLDSIPRVMEWCPTDTEENFKFHWENTPGYRERAISFGWDKPGVISYRLNSEGFRGDEFNSDNPNIVTLGCSYTFGIGLAEQDIWPSMLGQHLNLAVHNLAIPGSSPDRAFALAEYWLPILKPQRVYMATPCRGRMDVILYDGRHETIMPGDSYDGQYRLNEGEYYKQWIAQEQNSWVNIRRNEAAVAGLCYSLNIPVCIYRADECFGWGRDMIGYARDLMHAGIEGHNMVVENMLGIRSDYRRYY